MEFNQYQESCFIGGCKNVTDLLNISKYKEETFRFAFESEFDFRIPGNWIAQHWTLVYYVVAFYLLFIFGTQELMKKRERFRLQGLLIGWNILLAGFSIFGSFRVVPEIFDLLTQTNGIHRSVCSPVPECTNTFGFWTFLFILSKFPELGDTVFIVLRKQRLIFLHWYHHITVLIYCWHSYIQYISPCRWFVPMNYSVHALMYTYYVLKALKVKVPKPVAVGITSLQILQMFAGIIVNVYALSSKLRGSECDVPYNNLFWAMMMYGSYFYLFAQFFRKSYIKGGKGQNVKENIKLH